MTNSYDAYIKYKKKYFSLKYGGSSRGSVGAPGGPSVSPSSLNPLDGKNQSFDNLMSLENTHYVDKYEFIDLILKSSETSNILLNRLLINLVVEQYNYIEKKKRSKWYNYRTFKDFKQEGKKYVSSYQIDFEKPDKEIAKIISVLKNIIITNNESVINGFQFFVLLSKLIAIEHGNKRITDKHSTGTDLENFSTFEDLGNLENKKKDLFDNYIENEQKKYTELSTKIAPQEVRIADILTGILQGVTRDGLDILNDDGILKYNLDKKKEEAEDDRKAEDDREAEDDKEAEDDRKVVGLDDEVTNEEDILNKQIPLEFLKEIIEHTSTRNKLIKESKEIQKNKLWLLNVKKEWTLFTSISKRQKSLYLIEKKNKTVVPHRFLNKFYTDYYRYTARFSTRDLIYRMMDDPNPVFPPPKSTYKFIDEF